MANKVSKQIKDAEVIEDTKVTPTVEEQTEEKSVEQHEVKKTTEEPVQDKKKAFLPLPAFINEETVAKARPIVAKVLKGVAFAGMFYAGYKLKEALLGGNEDQEDYDDFDDTQELIDAEFTVVDSEE